MPFLRSTYSAGFVCRGVFAGQSGGHGDRGIGVSVPSFVRAGVEAAHTLEVSAQALEELLVVGQECHPVAVGLGVVEGDEQVLEVEVFNSQAQGFEQAQAAAVEEAGDEVRDGVKLGKDAQAFVMAEVGLDVSGSPGAHDVEVVERKAEDVAVEEQEGREGLGLGGSRNLLIGDEMGEEGFDPFGRLRTGFGRAHGAGVAQLVEADVTLVPVEIGLLSADGVSAQANGIADTFDKLSASAVGEFFLWHVSFADEVTNRLTDFRLCDR